MITDLNDLTALTESWLAELKDDDRELYEELAADLVIGPAERPLSQDTFGAAHTNAVGSFARFDLVGKQIGAFEFPPQISNDPQKSLDAYAQERRAELDVEGDVLFVGRYGDDFILSIENQVALLDMSSFEPGLVLLSDTFANFLLVQASAYDAYKREIVENQDEAAFWRDCEICAEVSQFSGTDVRRIYLKQLQA